MEEAATDLSLIKSGPPLQDPMDEAEQCLLVWYMVSPNSKETCKGLYLCLRYGV